MTEPASIADGLYDVPAGKLACIVTSLEMRRRPRVAGPVERADVTLRHVARPDLGWYRDLFRRVGAGWLWWSRLAMDDAELAAIVTDPAVEIAAATVDGVDHGLMELDFRRAGSCELAFLGVTPPLTGRGIGTWLVGHAVQRAWSRPIDRLWVHTCTLDHPAALTFYIRSGFTPFRRQVEVADDPRRLGLLPPEAGRHVPLLDGGA